MEMAALSRILVFHGIESEWELQDSKNRQIFLCSSYSESRTLINNLRYESSGCNISLGKIDLPLVADPF